MFNEAGLEPHEPTLAEEFTAKLKRLLQNRKLIDRCLIQEHIQFTGSADGFVSDSNAILDFAERMWNRDPSTIDVLEAVMEDLASRGRALIEAGHGAHDTGNDLTRVIGEHSLLHEIRALVYTPPFTEPFPFQRTTVAREDLSGISKSWFELKSEAAQPESGNDVAIEPQPDTPPPPAAEPVRFADIPPIEMIPDGEIVMLPPDDSPRLESSPDEGIEVDRSTIARNEALALALRERNINAIVVSGLIPPGSMREEPYNAFLLPARNGMKDKIVFVNDAYGNATFIVHEVDDAVAELREYAGHTKSELRSLGWEKVTRVIYPGNLDRWKHIVNVHIDYDAATLRENVERNRRERMIGYMSGNSISKLLKREYGIGMSPEVIKRFADILAQRPELAGQETIIYSRAYMAETKGDAELFTPNFADYILEFCVTVSKPNEHWRQVGGVLKDAKEALSAAGLTTSLDHETVDTMLRELLSDPPSGATGPFEVRNFLGKGTPPKEDKIPNNVFGLQEHFSPDLCKAVIDQLVRETVRPGWQTLNKIETDLKSEGLRVYLDMIWKVVQQMRISGGANFQFEYFRGTGAVRRTDDSDPRAANPRLRLHVSPDLAEAVKAHIRIMLRH